jgi:tyrosyl-tRNA synthetase
MSKSCGNYVGVHDAPEEMFGKIMSIPDSLMVMYWSLLTGASRREVESIERRLESGEYHPAEAKRDLGQRLVTLYHSGEAAEGARAHFDRVFREKDRPAEIPEASVSPEVVQDGLVWLPRLLTSLGLASSNGEARRLIEQGGVKLDDETACDPSVELDPSALRGMVVQVGKRKFIRIV